MIARYPMPDPERRRFACPHRVMYDQETGGAAG
jgi:hypothetical protein